MMYHTMVYTKDLAYEYTHSYAVHLFTERKLTAEEAFERAEELLDKHFPDWHEKLDPGWRERIEGRERHGVHRGSSGVCGHAHWGDGS
ncbi:MAG: hypothetical protein QXR62_04380 [Candidatus Bathyarchaeia archaeon]